MDDTVFSLNGQWSLRHADGTKVADGEVPGCNFTDLMRADIIPDPFYGVNESAVGEVAKKDWLYTRTFSTRDEWFESDVIMLVFEKLDTVATVTLNGKTVITADNYHLRHSADIKELLNRGENRLEVLFTSPVRYVAEKQAQVQCPINSNGMTGIAHIRKPQCHFGWDWGPILPQSGICGDAYIKTYKGVRISGARIEQEHLNESVTLRIFAEYTTLRSGVSVTVTVKDYEGAIIYKGEAAPTADGGTAVVTVHNPKLWQTYEWSGCKQPLYTVCISAYLNGELTDTYSQSVGLRRLTLDRTQDCYGNNFKFVLNGHDVFAKGADWIPPDSFPSRVTPEKLERYVKTAAESGFNMLRVWGGGYYESDDFYRLCDEYGILVWQDFCFACQGYPLFIDSFRSNVLKEVEYNVKRLRNHPCLCLWCGNNEIETMETVWAYKRRFLRWTEKFFYHILPEELRKYDCVTPYIEGSPVGSGYGKGVNSDGRGDTHLWAVWHGLQGTRYYRRRYTRFCSEFGFEAFPDPKCLSRFAEKEDYDLNGKVFSAHQKCRDGNAKMLFYIGARFRLPERFEDYGYLSGLCQSECVGDATEHWRRNKGRCNGSLYWQYDDCWPCCSWSSVDYYGNYKALQYNSKHFFKPLTLSVEDGKKALKVYLLNDLLREETVTVRLRLMDYRGKTFADETVRLTAEANAVRLIKTFSVAELKKTAPLKECVFVADMYENGELSVRKTCLFAAEKRLKLPTPHVTTAVSAENGVVSVRLCSDVFARAIALSSAESAPFSDNYFDLLPNESVTVTQKSDLSAESFAEGLTLRDVTAVKAAGSPLSDLIKRLRVFLKPINLLSYLWYKLSK